MWGNLFTQYPTTSNTGILLGSLASSTTDFSLTFDQPVLNPYFYADALNAHESITFNDPFTILQSKDISVSGSTITGSGLLNRDVGFVAQFLGVYTQIDFTHANNTSAYGDSFGFTTGGTPVPGPLPILAVGAALSQSRRLRRLSNRRGTRSGQAG